MGHFWRLQDTVEKIHLPGVEPASKRLCVYDNISKSFQNSITLIIFSYKIHIKNVFDFNQLNLIGFLGPLLKIFILSKRLDEIVDYIVKLKPNLIITVDSKLFSLNLAKRLKKRFYKE